jgi:universal stress protein family protein
VVPGRVVEAVVGLIRKQRFDLLVVGFMGHSQLYERIIGGTTDRLVRLAPCTVLVVKRSKGLSARRRRLMGSADRPRSVRNFSLSWAIFSRIEPSDLGPAGGRSDRPDLYQVFEIFRSGGACGARLTISLASGDSGSGGRTWLPGFCSM